MTLWPEHELTLEEIQRHQPWTVPYSDDFKRAGHFTPHNLAAHSVMHAMKSLGKIAAVFEAVDHRGGALLEAERATVQSMTADLLTTAIRLANLYSFSLVCELRRRVREKNGIDIVEESRKRKIAQLGGKP